MPKLINTFKTLPKELFRLNNGPSIRLRAWPTKPTGSYDLLTEAGKVKPKALNPNSYVGEISTIRDQISGTADCIQLRMVPPCVLIPCP